MQGLLPYLTSCWNPVETQRKGTVLEIVPTSTPRTSETGMHSARP